MPTLTAATACRIGFSASFFSAINFFTASDSATKAPVMAAVRVPPSACNTSQSTQIVRAPSFSQIERGAHGAADEPLDFRRTPVELALGDVARFALQGGVGEHRVFGGDPAALDFLFLHPARHGFLDGHAADDAGVAPFDERGAGGVRRDVVLKAQRTQLVGLRPSARRRELALNQA